MKEIDWNKLRDEAHVNSVEHGWWEGTPSDKHFLCLVISELMEAVEADRKNAHSDESILDCFMEPEKYKGSIGFNGYFEMNIKDTVEDELADAVIRLLDLAGQHNIDIHTSTIENISKDSLSLRQNSFTELIYGIVSTITDQINIYITIEVVIAQIVGLSKLLNINLVKHIELKMMYNKTRAYKHGKKY